MLIACDHLFTSPVNDLTFIRRRRNGRSLCVDLPRTLNYRRAPRSSSARASALRNRDANLETSEALRVRIFQGVKDQLDLRGVDTRTMTISSSDAFLPKLHDSELQRDIFERFLSMPITVSDRELAQIFLIKRSRDSDEVQKGSVCYYRSWSLTKEQLQNIIEDLERDGCDFAQLESWTFQLRGMDNHQRVWVRYVGQTTSFTPFQRCAKSTKGPKARGTLLNEFKRRYEVLDLEASRRIRVFALCDTATGWLFERYSSDRLTRSSRRITDSFERFLIAQFGSLSLLNQQAGGCGPSCIPSTRDTAMLSTIDTTVMRTLAQSVSQNMDLQVKPRLSAITETIYDAIRKRFPMDETTQENIQYIGSHHVKQAVCETLHGYCIAAVVGEAATEQSIREDTGVFDGS